MIPTSRSEGPRSKMMKEQSFIRMLVVLTLLVLFVMGGITIFWRILIGLALFGTLVMLNRRRMTQAGMTLRSIPISHYVERTRWLLDFLSIEYEERSTYPLLGAVFFLYERTLPTH